jgi:hypothetical protein
VKIGKISTPPFWCKECLSDVLPAGRGIPGNFGRLSLTPAQTNSGDFQKMRAARTNSSTSRAACHGLRTGEEDAEHNMAHAFPRAQSAGGLSRKGRC